MIVVLAKDSFSNGAEIVVKTSACRFGVKAWFFDNAFDLSLVIWLVAALSANNNDRNWVVTFMNAFNDGFCRHRLAWKYFITFHLANKAEDYAYKL